MSDFRNAILKFNAMYGLPLPASPQLYRGSRLETRNRLEQFKKILLDELSEVDEIIEGLDAGTPTIDVQVQIADWLGDIQVYCASEVMKYGLNNDVVLDIIMASNFSKLGADGKPIIRDGKVQKGPNYWKPEPKLKEYISASLAGMLSAPALDGEEKANTRQVGGSHYKTKHGLEHWDMVDMFKLDYFQGQITKYVMRWRDKGGVQDLKKARHFLDKYIELNGDSKRQTQLPEQAPAPMVVGNTTKLIVDQGGNDYWQNEGYYGDGTCLYSCRMCKHTTRATTAPGVPHGCSLQGALEPSDGAA